MVKNNKCTYISIKYYVGFMSYICNVNCFHTTCNSDSRGFQSTTTTKTISLVARQMTFVLYLHIDKAQRNFPKEVINFLCSTPFCIFLECTLSKRTFYFKDDLEFTLTTTSNMTCFIANFTLVLDLFTLIRDSLVRD